MYLASAGRYRLLVAAVVIARSPFLVVVGICSDFDGTAVNFVRSLAELVLTDMAQRYSIIAKFLLPGWRVGKSDQITRPLVQLGQRRSRLSAIYIPPDFPKYPLHSGLVVDFAVDMSIFAHQIG